MSKGSNIQRRKFLGGSLSALGALLLPSLMKAEAREETPEDFAPNISAFISESGNLRKGGLYAMGFLFVVGNTKRHENKLIQLRYKHQYKTRLTYKDGDRFKLDFAKEVIDYFVSTNQIRLLILVKNQEKFSENPGDLISNLSNTQIRKEKIKWIRGVKNRVGFDFSDVIVRSQSPYGPSKNFKDRFKEDTNYNYTAADIRAGNNILQLADFLAGSVYGGIKGEVKNKTKLELISYLKEQLNIADWQMSVNAGNKLRIIEVD